MIGLITRRDVLALGASLGALGFSGLPASRAATVLPHRHRRHRRHLLSGRRHDRECRLDRQDQCQRRRHQRLGRQRQWHRRRLDGVGLQPGRRQCLGLHRHRHLRGQAEDRGAARHRQPLSRERARRGQEGRGHQVARRPQGQARLDRRAGLRHARQRARAARRLRRHREGHQARVSEAAAVGRKVQGRLARRLLPDHRLSAGHARPSSPPPTASSCCRSTARRATRSWRSTSSSPRTRSRTASTRTSKGVETLAVGAQWITTSKQPDDLVYEITKALWSDKTRAAMDAGHAKGKEIRKETALSGVGIPLHAGAEKFYKEVGLLK